MISWLSEGSLGNELTYFVNKWLIIEPDHWRWLVVNVYNWIINGTTYSVSHSDHSIWGSPYYFLLVCEGIRELLQIPAEL